MAFEIINLTRQVVSQKVDEMVKNPQSSYHSAFSIPHLRQKLIARVLNHIPPCYRVSAPNNRGVEDAAGTTIYSSQEKADIERLIQDSIANILREENALHHFSDDAVQAQALEPSHWFG